MNVLGFIFPIPLIIFSKKNHYFTRIWHSIDYKIENKKERKMRKGKEKKLGFSCQAHLANSDIQPAPTRREAFAPS